MSEKNLSLRPLQGLMLFAPLCAGLFYEWSAAIVSLYLMGWLLCAARRTGALALRGSVTLLAMTGIAVFYGISALWAVDRGMALMGFVKHLPLPLFALALSSFDRAKRRELLEIVPLWGAVMTVLSLLAGLIPAFSGYIWINGRLGGFFQYPNTFAMYLLAGIILTLGKERLRWREFLLLAISLGGIALSGSRTVFLLLVAAAVFFLLVRRERRFRTALGGLMLLLLAGTGVYAAATGDLASVGRYLTASLSSSTFVGRFLYFRDALPVILRHPLGLGYMGYHFLQGSFQTGVYSVMHIHNDLLQLLLDVGWLPAALLIWALAKSFLARDARREEKAMMAALCLHALFDFDFQYGAMWLVLIPAMELEGKRSFRLKPAGGQYALCALVSLLCLYIGTANALYCAKAYAGAAALYPGYTRAWLELLPEAEDAQSMEDIADRILKQNDSVSLAHSAKARAAYARGDFSTMIAHKEEAIRLSPYSLAEYLDYFDMLLVGMDLYTQAGSPESAEYCRKKLLTIPDRLQSVLEGTSSLGWKIADQPELELPAEYLAALEALE